MRARAWAAAVLILPLLAGVGEAHAQFATVGAGVLVTERSTLGVAELNGQTPPVAGARAYATLSWTRESGEPTVITAVERPVLSVGRAFTGVGAGLLWLEANDRRPYPMLVSSNVAPLPVPRTSFVLIASALPFEAFDWSVVAKVGVTMFFRR